MPGTSMNPTKNDIPPETRHKIVDLLNSSLVNLIDLQLQSKQAHWNVKGPNFIALHQLFDGVAAIAEGFVDTAAERIVALGGRAEGTIGAVKDSTIIPAYPLDIVTGRDHVAALSTALATVGKAARAGIDTSTKLGDADTADLFTEVSRELDKQLWFVESHLQGDS